MLPIIALAGAVCASLTSLALRATTITSAEVVDGAWGESISRPALVDRVRRGYATAATDEGHRVAHRAREGRPHAAAVSEK